LGGQFNVIDRQPPVSEPPFKRRGPAGERLSAGVIGGGGVGPEIGEVGGDLEEPGDLGAEGGQRGGRLDVAAAEAGGRADAGGVVGEPAGRGPGQQGADGLVVAAGGKGVTTALRQAVLRKTFTSLPAYKPCVNRAAFGPQWRQGRRWQECETRLSSSVQFVQWRSNNRVFNLENWVAAGHLGQVGA
jgi:hypothetical protein